MSRFVCAILCVVCVPFVSVGMASEVVAVRRAGRRNEHPGDDTARWDQ